MSELFDNGWMKRPRPKGLPLSKGNCEKVVALGLACFFEVGPIHWDWTKHNSECK